LGTGSPNETSEKTYLATYLGLTVPQVETLYVFDKWEEPDHPWGQKDLSGGFSPGFSWDFAIIKIDGPNDYWYLFMDDNATLSVLSGDDKLTTPAQGAIKDGFIFNANNLGISHVTWFKSATQTAVPEPTTVLLLGLGLIGLAGLSRKN
jgi:hypothetical protein